MVRELTGKEKARGERVNGRGESPWCESSRERRKPVVRELTGEEKARG